MTQIIVAASGGFLLGVLVTLGATLALVFLVGNKCYAAGSTDTRDRMRAALEALEPKKELSQSDLGYLRAIVGPK